MKRILTLAAFTAALLLPLTALAQSTTGRVYVGHAKYNDQIWEYDGLSLDHDANVGCAILLTEDMIKPYVGGTITGMRVGWDTSQQTGVYSGFVRNDFNSEDLTTGRATVRYDYSSTTPGWNDMTLKKYDIPEDVKQLVVGFTTKLKKGVCSIPTLYPHNTPNSNFLWVEGDNDEAGNPIWRDASNTGILPIQLIIQDSKGTFNLLPVITRIVDDGIVVTGEASDALVRVKNAGSAALKSIEVTSRQGEQTFSHTVTLGKNIAAGATSSPFLIPIWCFHTGDLEVSITKANGREIANPTVHTLSLIGIPPTVSEQYERRPLVEYYESENNYMSPRYFDDYVMANISGKTRSITFVSQHLDDQFMTGDDDATALALRLCDNDSSGVSIPAMTIDRAISLDNILVQQGSITNPMFSVLLEPYGSRTIAAAINHPTFASVDVSGYWGADGQTVNVRVKGDVAEGVLPEGEQPRLTVYLMEGYVDSDSQLFWTEEEKEATKGKYTHYNIIREILSDPEGNDISAAGHFAAEFSTTVDPSWKKEDLYLVAFVHRDSQRGGCFMHVLNSAMQNIDDTDAIEAIGNEPLTTPATGKAQIYDLSGRRLSRTQRGLYITNGKKIFVK